MNMPVFFLGHGSPVNALGVTPFSQSLESMGKSLPTKPVAIMVISAHWISTGTFVSTKAYPETIYDFLGFPDALYDIRYPAPGAPFIAKTLTRVVPEILEDPDRGLDHGAWTVLKHIFPAADIPVFQLSVDYDRSMQYHYDLAQKLKYLRGEGVLVIGSGNIVHNLRLYYTRQDKHPYDWALTFDHWVKEKLNGHNFNSLINYEKMGYAANLAVPTVDHFVPLIYTLGLADRDDDITFTYEEVIASLSMRCLKIG